jgi:hypothetical protein
MATRCSKGFLLGRVSASLCLIAWNIATRHTALRPPAPDYIPHWLLPRAAYLHRPTHRRPHGTSLDSQKHVSLQSPFTTQITISGIKFSLCFKHYAMKTYGGVDVQIHIFLSSALDGGECSATSPGCFTPGENALCTHWIGGWVGPGRRSGRRGKENIIYPTGTRTSTPRLPSP